MARPTYSPTSIPAGTAAWDADFNQHVQADLVEFLTGGPLPLYRQSVGVEDAQDFELSAYFNKQTSSQPILTFSPLAPSSQNKWYHTARAHLQRNNRTTNGSPGIRGSVNTNEGAGAAVTFNVGQALNEQFEGEFFWFFNFTAHGLVLNFAGSDVLRNGATVTSAGGTATTTEIGAGIMIVLSFQATTAGQWFVEEIQGVWTFA